MGDNQISDVCCLRAHSELSIASDELSAEEIGRRLAIQPTNIEIKGDFYKDTIEVKKHKFYLSTKGTVTSNDTNDHLDWLIYKLKNKGDQISEIKKLGCRIAVSCSWWGRDGAGGPIVGPAQMRGMGNLDIPVGWLVWFNED